MMADALNDMDLRDLIGPRLEAAQVRDADGVAALVVDVISPVLERLRAELAVAIEREDYAARHLQQAEAERDALKAVIERVRADHHEVVGCCLTCDVEWPCPTGLALDGES